MTFFKHSSTAHSDPKLMKFMDLLGRDWKSGYFYFFTLLEMFSNNSKLTEVDSDYKFHLHSIRQLWRCNEKTVNHICQKLTESELIICDIHTNYVLFKAPNFMKYFGFKNTDKNKLYDNKRHYIHSESLANKKSDIGENMENVDNVNEPYKVFLGKNDFNEDRKSVKLTKREDGSLYWDRKQGYDLIADLSNLFPNIKPEIIKDECLNITKRLEKLSDEEYEERGPFKFVYLVNCLNKSKNNKKGLLNGSTRKVNSVCTEEILP